MEKTIYYLPGRGGRIHTGLGEGILELGYEIKGRETPDSFINLTFSQQLDLIIRDLQSDFWTQDAKVVAVSYGAYLLLHAMSELEPYPGSILLISPILGGVINKDTLRFYSPPRPNKVMELSNSKSFPIPGHIEIHVGDNDEQSPCERVIQFAKSVNGSHVIVPNSGHALGKDYIAPVLAKWLSNCD